MIKWIGSKYGGWNIDLDRIPIGSTVISAGLGNDITFDEELIRWRQCTIIGIDSTNLTRETVNKRKPKNFVLIRKVLYTTSYVKMMNQRTNGATIYSEKANLIVPCITLECLLNDYKNVSVIKMNIEGAEYHVLMDLKNVAVPQILVRFHHRKDNVPFDYNDTQAIISKVCRLGYKSQSFSDPKSKKIDYEVLFTYDK